jgi:hypothetical protein
MTRVLRMTSVDDRCPTRVVGRTLGDNNNTKIGDKCTRSRLGDIGLKNDFFKKVVKH